MRLTSNDDGASDSLEHAEKTVAAVKGGKERRREEKKRERTLGVGGRGKGQLSSKQTNPLHYPRSEGTSSEFLLKGVE